MSVNLYPHQIKALSEMKNGCVLKGGVGTGKSITSIAYYYTIVCGGDLKINGFGDREPMERPTDLYILTTARKRQSLDWEKECAPFGISKEREASFGNVKIHVDSWNNILKYKDVKNAFFIFDEQRLVGSGAWVKAFYTIAKNNQWVVLSATPGDTWMDYIPIFVANGFYKNRTEFLRRHVVFSPYSKFPKVDRYVETARLYKIRKSLLVEMPYERHTTRHVKNKIVEYDKELFDQVVKKRWNVYENKPIKNVGELFILMRKVVNSHPSRFDAICELTEEHPRLIVFYNFNYELDILRGLAEHLDITVAEWNGQKHQEVPETERWLYLVQYTAGSEAWNCITTDAVAFYSLNYSYKVNDQSRGRIDRLNTPFKDLYYYILRSNSAIDNLIVKALSTKQDFNERDYIKKF